MKLQAQYNRITVVSTLIVLIIAAIGYYYLIRYVLVSQLDDVLRVEEIEIQDYIRKHNKLPEPSIYKDQRITFEKTNRITHRVFKSRSTVHEGEEDSELIRQLLFPVQVNGETYLVSVMKSEEATENLVWIISFATVALLVLLMAILFFTNRVLLKKLWQPFRHTLSSIKEFNLAQPDDIKLQPTHIDEFKELNESINLMSGKVMKDFQSLKNFTDHASHEIQTPLAVINSRLDVLIQAPELSEKSMGEIQAIYTAVEKLARLSQSLLLLTRIENNQYTVTQPVPINEILQEKVKEMQELTGPADISMQLQSGPLNVTMNRELADVLTSNLLRNAIRHNVAGGSIKIETANDALIISNTGTAPLDENRIFDRFFKSGVSGGNGLGLAIVKQICDQYNFRLSYDFSGKRHVFTVYF